MNPIQKKRLEDILSTDPYLLISTYTWESKIFTTSEHTGFDITLYRVAPRIASYSLNTLQGMLEEIEGRLDLSSDFIDTFINKFFDYTTVGAINDIDLGTLMFQELVGVEQGMDIYERWIVMLYPDEELAKLRAQTEEGSFKLTLSKSEFEKYKPKPPVV